MKTDKLDRWRTLEVARRTMLASVPFWVTLSPRERSGRGGVNLTAYFRSRGADRKALRDFVRSMADRPRPADVDARSHALADRYFAVFLRLRHTAGISCEDPAGRLISRRGWVLRHGSRYGVECL